jgi:hypothetical protein
MRFERTGAKTHAVALGLLNGLVPDDKTLK